MATLAFENVKQGDGKARRQAAETTYNTFKRYFIPRSTFSKYMPENDPATNALGKMTPEERDTKLAQAIAFLKSVPGFEAHAKRLQLLQSARNHMFEIEISTYLSGLVNAPNIKKITSIIFPDLNFLNPTLNTWGGRAFPKINFISEPKIELRPPRDPRRGLRQNWEGTTITGHPCPPPSKFVGKITSPIFDFPGAQERMAEYLAYRRDAVQEKPKPSENIKPSANMASVSSLLAGTEIITIPFSELGDKGAKLQELVDRLKAAKNITIKVPEKPPEGKKE